MGDERIDLLRNTSIFAAMTPDALELLLDRAQERKVPKGEYFFREGDDEGVVTVTLAEAEVGAEVEAEMEAEVELEEEEVEEEEE